MRFLILALSLVLGAAAASAGAEPHHDDTYQGQRAYPDPYIWDGWLGSGGYRGRDYYARAPLYLLRRQWPARAYEHRWTVADDIESLSRD